MKPRLVFAILMLIGVVCAGTVSGAAEIVLEAPKYMSYSFNGSPLEIPVSLAGSESVLQLVIVQSLDWDYPPWSEHEVPTAEERFLQGLDPLVYVAPQKLCPEGVNTVIWYGRDMEHRLVPYDEYRYYVFAFDPGSVPDSLDYGKEHRSEILENMAGMMSEYIIGHDWQPTYPLVHFTDTVRTSEDATVNLTPSLYSSMGNPFTIGDEIGVFSPRGDLVGAFVVYLRSSSQWTYGSFNVYEDDPSTPVIDGMQEGEPMTFVIWDFQTDTELPVRAAFAKSDSLYTSRMQYHLESLHVIDTTAVSEAPPVPFSLHQNSPNPFNPVTAIPFSLAEPSDISLIIYNATGATVAVLAEGLYPPGRHSVSWDASDHASGLYFYRLNAGGTALTGKMMLVK